MNRVHTQRFITLVLCLLFSGFTLTAGAQQARWVEEALDGRACSQFGFGGAGGYGPYDYRFHKANLPIVEEYHFNRQVEQLVRGMSTTHPMGDITYTLIAFPNHHRALYSAVNFSLGQSRFGERDRYRAECFLQRAIHFAPEDPTPYLLFGLYLHRLGELDQSLEMYHEAEELAPNDANLLYNMGLVHFDKGNYDESRRYAQEAYQYGIELPGLRRKLEEAGHWE